MAEMVPPEQEQSNSLPKGLFSRGYGGEKFDTGGRIGPDELDELLIWAMDQRVSDVTIQPNLPVTCDMGGQIVFVTERALYDSEIEHLLHEMYGPTGPGQMKAGYDLDFAHEIWIKERNERIRFRVNATSCRITGGDGIQLTIRTLPSTPISIDELEVEPDILDNLRPRQGMVLVTGPTGSGKSTLLSSGIRMIVEREDANEKIVEYSRPIEFVYDQVNMPSSVVSQTEVGKHLRPKDDEGTEESAFSYSVRNALRRKPTIIMIGEARDKATIGACIEASLTGHLLFTTMHTIGVAETLRRAIQPFPIDAQRGIAVDLLETIRMIVTQQLVPRKGGGMCALREYMVFDETAREHFFSRSYEEWPQATRELFQLGTVPSQTFKQAAERAFWREEKISKEVYDSFVRRAIAREDTE